MSNDIDSEHAAMQVDLATAQSLAQARRNLESMSLVFRELDASTKTRPRWSAYAERVAGLGLAAGTSSTECFALAQRAPTLRLQGFFVGLALARLPLEKRHRSMSRSRLAAKGSRARRRTGRSP